MGAPLTESPTKYINSDMQKVINEIKERIFSANTDSETSFFFFTGGNKDLHIPLDSNLSF